MTTSNKKSSQKIVSEIDAVNLVSQQIEDSLVYQSNNRNGKVSINIKSLDDDLIEIPNSRDLYIDRQSILKIRDGKVFIRLQPLPEVERVDICEDEELGFITVYHVKIGNERAKLSTDVLVRGYGLWIDAFPSAIGLDNKWNREAYVSVIRYLAKSAPHFHFKKRTGVHKDDDGVHFLLGDHIYIRGNIEPKIHWHLQNESEKRIENFKTLSSKDINAMINTIMGIAPKGQLIINITHFINSLLNQLRPDVHKIGYSLCNYGIPETLKTSVLSLARSLAYYYDHSSGFDFLFSGNLAPIELVVDRIADLPLGGDDFRKRGDDKEYKEKLKLLDSLVFAAHNHKAIKPRATRNMTQAPDRKIRSLPSMTAEFLPPFLEKSFYRRILAIKFETGDIITYTDGKHLGIADYGYEIEGDLKLFYAQIAQSVLNHLNEDNKTKIGQTLIDTQKQYAKKFENEINQLYPNDHKDYRESLCKIAGSLMATAKYIDDLFTEKTKRSKSKEETSFQKILFPILVNAIHNQLIETTKNVVQGFDRPFSDILIDALYEQLEVGISHNGGFYCIELYEKNEDLPSTEPIIIGKPSASENIARGWNDRPKERFILSNDLQKELLKIAKNEAEEIDWDISKVFDVLNFDKRIVAKPKSSSRKGFQHIISATNKKETGWHIDSEWAYQRWLERKGKIVDICKSINKEMENKI